jgi:hypothetical protein
MFQPSPSINSVETPTLQQGASPLKNDKKRYRIIDEDNEILNATLKSPRE